MRKQQQQQLSIELLHLLYGDQLRIADRALYVYSYFLILEQITIKYMVAIPARGQFNGENILPFTRSRLRICSSETSSAVLSCVKSG